MNSVICEIKYHSEWQRGPFEIKERQWKDQRANKTNVEFIKFRQANAFIIYANCFKNEINVVEIFYRRFVPYIHK